MKVTTKELLQSASDTLIRIGMKLQKIRLTNRYDANMQVPRCTHSVSETVILAAKTMTTVGLSSRTISRKKKTSMSEKDQPRASRM